MSMPTTLISTQGNSDTPTPTFDGSMVVQILDQTYTLTGSLGEGLVLEYHKDFDQAISLGQVGTIAPRIADALGFKDLGDEITHVLGEVAKLKILGEIAQVILSASARITDLEINTQTSTYGVGLALDFTTSSPLPKISSLGIELLALGFKVTKSKDGSTTS